MCHAGGTRALLLLALALCCPPRYAGAQNDNYQMSDICKKYFLRDLYRKIDGAVLISQNERDLDCAITFQTHSILQRFMLRFDQLQLDCNDHLYIYDGAHAVGSYKCDKTKCPGPLRYYQDLNCKPVYKNPDDCCAARYDCSHLKTLSLDKCYVNGDVYSIGEKLKKEHLNTCEGECHCEAGIGNNAGSWINCTYDTNCDFGPLSSKCYFKNSPNQCCPGPEVCLDKPEDRPTCEVDGETYKDGERFVPKSHPELDCYCMPGYTGENVEPYCKRPSRQYCHPLQNNVFEVSENCAPVYYHGSSPNTDCTFTYRCQNDKDSVIHKETNSEDTAKDENMMCKFGNLTLHIGDELNQDTSFLSVCMECVCEVPPAVTCVKLPDDRCDRSRYEGFIVGYI